MHIQMDYQEYRSYFKWYLYAHEYAAKLRSDTGNITLNDWYLLIVFGIGKRK